MATNIRYGIGAPKEATREDARKLIDAAYALMLDFRKRGLIQRVGPFLDQLKILLLMGRCFNGGRRNVHH